MTEEQEPEGAATDEDLCGALLDRRQWFRLCTGQEPYDYQVKVLEDRGREVVVVKGRQVGMSTACGVGLLQDAVLRDGFRGVVVSRTQPQAMEFFEKSVAAALLRLPEIGRLVKRQTMKSLRLDNGSGIDCVPSTPGSVRSYSPDRVIIDEAAFVDDPIFVEARAALVKTLGQLVVVSTPFGRRGAFWEMTRDPGVSLHTVPSAMCPEIGKKELERLRTSASVTETEWRQEYMAEFVDESDQWFPHALIAKCLDLGVPVWHEQHEEGWRYWVGVDPARGGRDEAAYAVVARKEDENIVRLVHVEVTSGKGLLDVVGRSMELQGRYQAEEVGVDAQAIGAGVYEELQDRGVPVQDRSFTGRYKSETFKRLKAEMEQGRFGMLSESSGHPLAKKAMLEFLDLGYEYTREGLVRVGADVGATRSRGRKALDDIPCAVAIAADLARTGRLGLTMFLLSGPDSEDLQS